MPAEPSSPAPRLLKQAAALLALALSFAASLLTAAFLHLDLAVTRRTVRRLTNVILADALAGELVVGEIERLSPSGIRIAHFRASSDGREVLMVEDVRLQAQWLAALFSVAWRGGGVVDLPHVSVERAAVAIETHEGELTLARAFSPREKPPEPEKPPEAPTPPRFGIRFSTIELGTVEVTGALAEGVPLEATVSRLIGRFETGPEGVAVDVARSSVQERRVFGTPAQGTADFHLRSTPASADGPGELASWGSFGGHLGELELHARALYQHGRVEAELELPRVGSRELRPWFAGRPLERPLSARARLHGRAPLLHLDGDVSFASVGDAPPGELRMQGRLHLSEQPLLEADLEVQKLDARVFGTSLPSTDLNATLRVRGSLAGERSELRASVVGAASRIDDEPVPPLSGTVAVARAGIEAWLVVDEPGARSDLHARFATERGADFAFRAEAADLSAVPRLQRLLGRDAPRRGSVRIAARGTLARGEVDVVADGRLQGAQGAGMSVQAGRVRARLRGPRDALRLDASASGSGLHAGGQRLERFSLDAHGPALHPTVHARLVDEQERHIDARAVVDAKAKTARNVKVDVEKSGVTLSGRIDRIASQGAGVRIEGIELRGLGGASIEGGLTVERGELVGKLRGRDVDLEPLSKLVGLPYRLRGKGNVDVDLARERGGRRGHIRLQLEDAGMLVVSGVHLDLDARFDGSSVEPRVRLRLEGEKMSEGKGKDRCGGTIAELAIEEGSGELKGPLLDPDSWKAITGRAKIVARDLQLRCLAEVWDTFDPSKPLPLERIEGVVDATAEIARDEPQGYPSLPSVTLRTRGLVLTMRGADGDAAPPFSTERLDVGLRGSFDADSGEAELDVRLLDERAPGALAGSQLVRLHGTAGLDLDALLAGGARAREALERTPISVAIESERRPIEAWQALPSPLRSAVSGGSGEVEIDAFAEGSLMDPSVAVRARAWSLGPAKSSAGEQRWTFPVDLDLMANYSDGSARADATIRHDGRTIASLEASGRGDLGATLRGAPPPTPWKGSLDLKLRRLPLEALPPLADKRVSGEVDGHLSIADLGGSPSVRGRVHLRRLRVGRRFELERARFDLSPIEGEPGVVTVVVDLAERCRRSRCGTLRGTAYGTLGWKDGLWPRPDAQQPAAVYLVAKDFPLAVVQPLVTPDVSRLRGRLNGEARLAYRELVDRDVAIDIDMRLDGGVVHIPALGQEFYNVEARLRAEPNLVRIDDLRASAASGALSGKLVARLDGLELQDLSGEFSVAEDEKMPLVVQGAPLGTASVQKLLVHAQGHPDEIDVALSAQRVRIELPPSASNDVQGLEDHPEVSISDAVAPPPEPEKPSSMRPINFTISVDDAEIRTGVQRIAFATKRDAPIRYQGKDERLRGIVELTGGELNLLGRMFEIERGHVRLREEEPDNPYVSLAARWDSPEATVFIDYIGPLKPIDRDKIRFRSSPPMSEEAIVATLLFGESAVVSGGGEQTGDGSGGQELGSRIAAQQVNDVLSEIAPGLSTSFGTTEESTEATVAYHFSDRVTAQATFESARGESAAVEESAEKGATGADNTARNTKLSVDWRFAPNWLLRGFVGLGDEPSSGLDVLWQYRY